MKFVAPSLFIALLLASARPVDSIVNRESANDARRAADLRALAVLNPIDAHAHIWKTAPEFTTMLERWNLHILDILRVDDKQASSLPLNAQRAASLAFIRSAHGHASLCTTFDPFQFTQRDFIESTINSLNTDFANGAIAVKIWKNIGMELKDSDHRYVMPDDPRLDPIYRDIEAHNKTLIAHQAEPDVAWGPPDPNALDASYYAEHPEWDMTKIPDAPSKQTILAARDHLLALHPHLRVIGAHLGSMESDVNMIAERFDRYPNFAIDTGARVPHLTIQPSAKVRAFLIKYQDRVLYGTDIDFSGSETGSAAVSEWEEQLALDWRYFASEDRFDYNGRSVQGLRLPAPVLRKIFHDNAIRWLPGINDSAREN